MGGEAAAGESRIALAAVAGAHGVRGEVRLKLFGSVEGLASQKSITVGGRELPLESVRAAGKGAVARFAGINDRSAAEALRGQLVEIDRTSLPPLGEDEYYHADLVGRPCVDREGNPVGTVAAVENFGAGDLLDVERPDGKRSLIPFRHGIAELEDGSIVLDLEFLA
jgi:16S rRNA processing protein RimM